MLDNIDDYMCSQITYLSLIVYVEAGIYNKF